MADEYVDIPIFDMLGDCDDIFLGFGDILAETSNAERIVETEIQRSIKQYNDFHAANIALNDNIPHCIESYVKEMLDGGWNHKDNNLAIFAQHFGLLLAGYLQRSFGGQFIFRSEIELNYTSLWWPKSRLEIFPFLHIKRRLMNEEGVDVEHYSNVIKSLTEKD